MQVAKQSKQAIARAVEFLSKGAIVICPTDTVYGFLADASDKKAADKIYKIKKRPKSKPLPVFVKDINMAKSLAEISREQLKILRKYWPGKYTFILNRKKPCEIGSHTIALRIPRCKFLNDLLKKINKPLVQTSVNISGQAPLAKTSDIIRQFGRYDILLIDGGNLVKRKPSSVMDFTKKKIKVIRK